MGGSNVVPASEPTHDNEVSSDYGVEGGALASLYGGMNNNVGWSGQLHQPSNFDAGQVNAASNYPTQGGWQQSTNSPDKSKE